MSNTTSEKFMQSVEQLSADAALAHRFVQGGAEETVELGGVPTPTLRKLAKDIDAREGQLAVEAAANAQASAEAAAQSATDAQEASVKANQASKYLGYLNGGTPASESVITLSGGTPSSFA